MTKTTRSTKTVEYVYDGKDKLVKTVTFTETTEWPDPPAPACNCQRLFGPGYAIPNLPVPLTVTY